MMNENDHPHNKFKASTNPSHDPGGGGDATFHQAHLKPIHLPESQQYDANANNELVDVTEAFTSEHSEEVEFELSTVKNEAEQPLLEKQGERQEHVEGKDHEVVQDETKGKTTKTEEEKVSQDQKKEGDPMLVFSDPKKLNRLQRSEIYTKACTLQQKGKTDQALKCFLASLTGLTEDNSFHELPQCLHQVSNIYFEKNEYEKAVHFIQAEKMYYETALIDIVNLQKQLGEKRKQREDEGKVTSTDDDDAQQSSKNEVVTDSKEETDPEITKAREFENLARLCLKEGKPQLALEYWSELGDDHPVTVGSLDLFAIIYADVGKKLYEDAMKKFGVEDEKEHEDSRIAFSQQESPNTQDGSVATENLRQREKPKRKAPEGTDQRRAAPERTVHSEEYEPSPSPDEQDDWITTVLLMILFVLVTVLFALIFSYFYCRDNNSSEMCAELKGDLTYWYMRIQYTYKYYVGYGWK